MPTYSYECQDCEADFERILPLAEYKAPQTCDCGSDNTQKLITAVGLNFPGDGWASKNGRIQRQMVEKNKKLAKKEKDYKRSGRIPTLVPTVNGEQTESWSDATKLAKDKGKDTTGYEKFARKEKSA